MKQTSNRQPSVSYLYYFLFGLYLTAEPFFLKQFFETYFPDFHYRALTISISVAVGIVGFLKLKEANGDTTIGQTVTTICQTYANLLNPEFWKKVLSYCQICCRVFPNLLMSPFSQEPTVHLHSKKAFKYFGWTGIFFSLLFVCICYLFLINLARWGLFETSLTTLFYLFCICLTSIALTSLPTAINAAKQLRNARRSESDLNALLKLLRKELKGWQFEKRVVLPSDDPEPKGDIDIVGISPDDNYFVIELKSHIGEVLWNSEADTIYRRFDSEIEAKPFKEGDLLGKMWGQARKLKKHKNLSRLPERILVFWRAWVHIPENDRIKQGVLVSDRKHIAKDLKKRNRQLVKKRTKRSNSNHTIHS